MPKFTNVSPLGALEVPALRRVVEHGETVEVADERALSLAAQPATWEPADDDTREWVLAHTEPVSEPATGNTDTDPSTSSDADTAGATETTTTTKRKSARAGEKA